MKKRLQRTQRLSQQRIANLTHASLERYARLFRNPEQQNDSKQSLLEKQSLTARHDRKRRGEGGGWKKNFNPTAISYPFRVSLLDRATDWLMKLFLLKEIV